MPAPANPRLALLDDYPFRRLDRLLGPPPANLRPVVMSIGEPQHEPPTLIAEILTRNADGWGRYPPTRGTDDFRKACASWLTGRFSLPQDMVDPGHHVLPVAGTREGLFAIALATMPEKQSGRSPLVLIPDPFYQVYRGAAIMAGAEPYFLPATRRTGFLPDLDALDAKDLSRIKLVYLCSPANPQGAVADLTYLSRLVEIVRTHDALLVVDECYSEIYDATPPPGVLEACRESGGGLENVLAFHSLSKRSSVPGLRSGFVAGDAAVLEVFLGMRTYGGGQQPLPVQAVAAALWRDETHVEKSRDLYREKFDAAEEILGGRFCFYRPAGGFFLWLDVGNGEQAAQTLWQQAGVRVMPGSYLASSKDGDAERHVRVALTPNIEETREGLRRIASTL